MKAEISTLMQSDEEKVWRELQKVSSLLYVASPLLKFRASKKTLPERWERDCEYRLMLTLFGCIPLGEHCIRLVELNSGEKRIRSLEHGAVVRVWNHTITLINRDGMVVYTDELEIDAGLLTLPVWLFAHVFYRHRQRRWKKLLAG